MEKYRRKDEMRNNVFMIRGIIEDNKDDPRFSLRFSSYVEVSVVGILFNDGGER